MPVGAYMKAEYLKSRVYLCVSILLMHQQASVPEKFRNKFKLLLVRTDLHNYSHK